MKDDNVLADNNDEQMEEVDDDDPCESIADEELPQRKRKPGIVYLSSIPIGMNPQLVRDFLGVYGEIGKSYLQSINSKHIPCFFFSIHLILVFCACLEPGRKIRYSEGWVEFKSKRVAKLVAERLNNTKVGGKKRSKYHDCLWTIKYLPRFKWAHLNERLAYEKAVRQQRMQNEIAQVKRETNFFIESVEKSHKIKRKPATADGWQVSQRLPEEEIRQSKAATVKTDRTQFLKSLFKPATSK